MWENTWLEALNELGLENNTMQYWNDMAMYGDYANTMAWVDTAINIFMLISFIWMWYGLYTLAKKMNIKNAWMGWVPLLQMYTMTQVAGLDFKKYILYPILIIIGIAIVGWVWMAFGWENVFLALGMIVWIAYIVAYIYYIVRYIQILSATSKRTWRGGWTTFGLFFIPFIMYPVIAYKFKSLKEENKEEEKTIEL